MIFRSMWIGDGLGPLEWLCVSSFISMGHEFELYTNQQIDVPDGCTIRSISEVCPDVEPFAYKSGFGAGSYAAFSNVFRYTLLFRLGGWWVDMDVYCLSASWPDADLLMGYQDEKTINNAVMFSARPEEVLFEQAMQLSRQAGRDVKWGEIGPGLMTRLMQDRELRQRVRVEPSNTFYPVGYRDFLRLMIPDSLTLQDLREKGSVCLHLWNEMFRFYKLDKNILPPDGSILRQCFEEAGMTSGFKLQYSVDRVNGKLLPVPYKQ